ncbi:uncharacterized protein LOC129005418 [Macrosteles quadrilineatus]|uniref:uncharacterized protein LOC128994720 n=1 Tax=Macrosteles quadrilineatus TaxID=74068 RepID=UPI0023E2F1A5|nr:uncharacterized protein LOC128994720 [Macrosteles quadrilineatus]XP_054290280.1 uncharacterized protein LOC129005418 [Macrosteles quadrilineatus]XP_054290281.1 uncharacterized protein LOC129005418 [Macrosteles quadrilineatus]
MAAGAVLLVAAVVFIHGADSGTPPKFIKAAYGVQKALYAKDYGYSLVPIPPRILKQAFPPKNLPLVGPVPEISRQGRALKYYRGRSSSRRRRKRPTSYRKRPSSYGVPVYATKYKNYIPSRRPPHISPYSRYKKKRRPYRGPPRRPTTYREVPPEFDDYEQEIPTDDYDEYDHRDEDYPYFDIPSKRLPLEYDKEFLNRHADLYNRGYNPGVPRGRPKDVIGQYTDHVRTRVRYQPQKEEHHEHHEHHVEHPEKHEESQENLWPGEVSNVHTNLWQDSASHSDAISWGEESHTPPPSWHEQSNEWNNPRPPRQDNQWQVYQPQQHQNQQQQTLQTQHFQWPPRPTRAQDLRAWTTSLRPKPQAAAVNHPSRPVVSREQETQSTRQVYNWDPVSHTYQLVESDTRPKYQSHYSEQDFRYSTLDRKSTESKRSHRAYSEPDIGYGQGMEVIDDGVAGWKVKK